MADSRFFTKAGSLTLTEIAALSGAAIASSSGPAPDGSRRFDDVAPLDRAGQHDVSFLDNSKYIEVFSTSKAGACFVRPAHAKHAPEGMALLVTEQPYYAFALLAQQLYPEDRATPGISPHAYVAASATVANTARVQAGAIIGERATIGEHAWVGAHTVIGDGVEIGGHTNIGSHCSITHALIGKRTIIHRGVHIGQDGFGFAAGPKGLVKMPQLGRVLIGNDVEIGSGTCIDRGAGPDTIIGDGCKIDNLVQIGHNVKLGRHVIVVAQVGISGSTHIGDGVQIGGQTGIAGHLRIGNGVKIAAQSGVMTDVPDGESYGGAPAMPIREWHRQTVAVMKMSKKKESNDE